MKHRHIWQFVRTYWNSPFVKPFREAKMAYFICSCGLVKIVEVKEDADKMS